MSILANAAGQVRATLDPIERPVYFVPDPQDAFPGVTKLSIVRGLLADFDEKARQEAPGRLCLTAGRDQTSAGILWGMSAWLVRAPTAREGKGS